MEKDETPSATGTPPNSMDDVLYALNFSIYPFSSAFRAVDSKRCAAMVENGITQLVFALCCPMQWIHIGQLDSK